MVTTVTFDPEGAARQWLRDALPGVGNRVFFAVPAGEPTLPLVTIQRVGGAPQRGEAPVHDVRLSFSVYGNTKHEAARVEATLVSMLNSVQSVDLDGDTYCYGAQVTSVIWIPDPNTGTPRYVIDATLTLRAG